MDSSCRVPAIFKHNITLDSNGRGALRTTLYDPRESSKLEDSADDIPQLLGDACERAGAFKSGAWGCPEVLGRLTHGRICYPLTFARASRHRVATLSVQIWQRLSKISRQYTLPPYAYPRFPRLSDSLCPYTINGVFCRHFKPAEKKFSAQTWAHKSATYPSCEHIAVSLEKQFDSD